MDRIRALLQSFLAAFLIAGAATDAVAIEIPKLTRRVTDLAGVLTAQQADEIESRLKQFEDSTSNQLLVLIIPTLDGEPLEDFTINVARENKIGQEGKNNGALFCAVINDRKMRFEVGYGLEPTLTDAYTRAIQEQIIKPRFKESDYYTGILEGMDAAMKATQGEFTAEPKSGSDDVDAGVLPFIVVVLVFLVGLAIARKAKGGKWTSGSGSRWTSGGGWSSGSGWSGSSGWSSGGSSSGWSGGGGDFGGGGSSSSW